MFSVQYWDEESEIWISKPLDMCSPHRNCGCLAKGEMDMCDNAFDDTPELQIAKDAYEMLIKEGNKARILQDGKLYSGSKEKNIYTCITDGFTGSKMLVQNHCRKEHGGIKWFS